MSYGGVAVTSKYRHLHATTCIEYTGTVMIGVPVLEGDDHVSTLRDDLTPTPTEKHNVVSSLFKEQIGSRRCDSLIPIAHKDDPLLRIQKIQDLR